CERRFPAAGEYADGAASSVRPSAEGPTRPKSFFRCRQVCRVLLIRFLTPGGMTDTAAIIFAPSVSMPAGPQRFLGPRRSVRPRDNRVSRVGTCADRPAIQFLTLGKVADAAEIILAPSANVPRGRSSIVRRLAG